MSWSHRFSFFSLKWSEIVQRCAVKVENNLRQEPIDNLQTLLWRNFRKMGVDSEQEGQTAEHCKSFLIIFKRINILTLSII